MHCSTRQFLFLVLIIGLVLMRESRVAPLASIETAFATWLSVNAQRSPAPAPLAVVQITDEDLSATPWPWTPLDFSLFLNAALPYQPPVVGIEPILSWSKPDAQQVSLLHNQLLKSPKVVLGSELGNPEDLSVLPALQEVPTLRHVKGDLSSLREFMLVERQPMEDLRLAGTLGFENLEESASKPIQFVPLIFRYHGQVVPSFVLQAAMLWYGVTPDEVKVICGSHIDLGKKIQIPIDAHGGFFVDFSIPMTRFSTGDLLLSVEQSQVGRKTVAPIAQLKNCFTLLARTDREARTLRFANGQRGSRGELFAAALATLQNAEFVEHDADSNRHLMIELVIVMEALIVAWFFSRMSKLGTLMVALLIFAGYMLAALGAFSAWLVVFPFLLPAGLLAFIVLFRMLDREEAAKI
ncbi:MAG: CHASE2 domain-containing protein [Verrucomicrobiota bacterium]